MAWNGSSKNSSRKNNNRSNRKNKSSKTAGLKRQAYNMGIILGAKDNTVLKDSLNAGKHRATAGKQDKKPLF